MIDEISSAYTSRYLFAGYERFKVWTDLFRVERQHLAAFANPFFGHVSASTLPWGK